MSMYRDKVLEMYKFLDESGVYTNSLDDIEIKDSSGGVFKANSARLFTVLTGLVSHGSMLYVGGKGEAKTRLAKAAGVMFTGMDYDDLQKAIIRGHPEQTEEKMIAYLEPGKLITKGEQKVVWRTSIESPVRIIDEVSRLPPSKTSLLFSLLAENEVEYMNEYFKVPDSRTFGTMNWDDKGTYPLTPPFMDRWGVSVPAYQATVIDQAEILQGDNERLGQKSLKEILKDAPTLSTKDWPAIYKEIADVEIDSDASLYVISLIKDTNMCIRAPGRDKGQSRKKTDQGICQAPNKCHYYSEAKGSLCHLLIDGLSTRSGKESLYAYSKALAYFLGSPVTVDIIEAVFPYVMLHRTDPTPKGKWEKEPYYSNDEIKFHQDFAALSKEKLSDRKKMLKIWSDGIGDTDIASLEQKIKKLETAANADLFATDLLYSLEKKKLKLEGRLR